MKRLYYLICYLLLTTTAYSFNSYGDSYQFDVITKTGDIAFADNHEIQRTLIDIKRNSSVNENGIIAFIGKVEGTFGTKQENVYAVKYEIDSESKLTIGNPEALMQTAFELKDDGDAPNQVFANIQINNQNQVVAYRLTYAMVLMKNYSMLSMPLSYVEKWDANINSLPLEPKPELIACGDAKIGSSFDQLTPISPSTIFKYPSSFVVNSPWDGIFSRISMNNNGESVFVPMNGDKLFMAVSKTLDIYDSIEIIDLPNLKIADTGKIIFYQNKNGVRETRLTQYDAINSSELISTTEQGVFTNPGINPTISDDGQYIVFYDELNEEGSQKYDTTPGPGIFVYLPDKRICRINGISYNDHLDPGELYQDQNLNGKFDQGENDQSSIIDFYPNEYICVNNSGDIIYFAKNQKGKKAIFRSRIYPKDDQYQVSGPVEIISIGDSISDLPGTVHDLSLFDSYINKEESGELVFWAEMNDSTKALVLARVKDNSLIFIPDIDGNNTINLKDAISGLRIISRMTTNETIYIEADINGDQKIGTEEILYILKTISVLKSSQ